MGSKRYPQLLVFIAVVLLLALAGTANSELGSFRFVIIGDRTGEAVPGVYEHAWQAAAAEHPAFVVGVGDTIEGLNDATAAAQWRQVAQILKPYRSYPFYFAPGNHDIWSAPSEQLFRKYAAHPPHYGFDYEQAHFTVLDNSRTEEFSAGELAFLEQDLKSHAAQPVKFILSHRPSWLIGAALQNPNFALHRLARQYGVQYVIAGHLHQMMRLDLQGLTYISVPSSGGHLRASRKYQDGWFFGHILVEVHGSDIHLQIEELTSPHGQGRITKPADWGMLGLVEKP